MVFFSMKRSIAGFSIAAAGLLMVYRTGEDANALRAGRALANFDPKTVKTKSLLPHVRTLLQPDGTYFFPVFGERLDGKAEITNVCPEFIADYEGPRKIKRIRLHSDICGDESVGNTSIVIYGFRLLAHAMGVPFTFSCGELVNGMQSVMSLHQIDEEEARPPPLDKDGNVLTLRGFCSKQKKERCAFWNCPNGGLEVANTLIQESMQFIANTPEVNRYPADDAVIHLRLGDALKPQVRKPISTRGLLPHAVYANIITSAEREKGPMKSISVVTSPFDGDVREKDFEYLDRSRMIAEDLVSYLQLRFPNAEVHIYNDVTQAPRHAHARLSRANKVAICGCSSFCGLPVVGVNDDALGYFMKSSNYNQFATPLSQMREGIRVFDPPMLGNNEVGSLTNDEILQWLRSPVSLEKTMNKDV